MYHVHIMPNGSITDFYAVAVSFSKDFKFGIIICISTVEMFSVYMVFILSLCDYFTPVLVEFCTKRNISSGSTKRHLGV